MFISRISHSLIRRVPQPLYSIRRCCSHFRSFAHFCTARRSRHRCAALRFALLRAHLLFSCRAFSPVECSEHTQTDARRVSPVVFLSQCTTCNVPHSCSISSPRASTSPLLRPRRPLHMFRAITACGGLESSSLLFAQSETPANSMI